MGLGYDEKVCFVQRELINPPFDKPLRQVLLARREKE
jgi:hypothetical protein